jgi:L-lactate dehydrogenase
MPPHKIAIIGAGSVGASIAYATMLRRLPAAIQLVDINTKLAHGQTMDLADVEFLTPAQITAGSFEDASRSDAIVITAGAKQQPNETRQQLKERNVGIIKKIIADMEPINPNAIIIVVSNPVLEVSY